MSIFLLENYIPASFLCLKFSLILFGTIKFAEKPLLKSWWNRDKFMERLSKKWRFMHFCRVNDFVTLDGFSGSFITLNTGGPRYSRSFCLRFRLFAVQKLPFSKNQSFNFSLTLVTLYFILTWVWSLLTVLNHSFILNSWKQYHSLLQKKVYPTLIVSARNKLQRNSVEAMVKISQFKFLNS